MFKKIITASMIVLITITGIFAQGSTDTNDNGKVALVYQNGFDPVTSGDGVAHDTLYKEYQEETGIEIQHNIMNYAQSREKMVISGQAGDGPDCIHMLAENVPEYVGMNIIQDITSEMKAWKDYDKFPENAWEVASIDGKIYGIPSCASTRMLIYREDLLNEAGLEVPTTWEDLRTAAKTLTKDKDGDGKIDVYGFAFCSSSDISRGPQEFGVYLYSVDHGEFAIQKDNKWVPGFSVEQAEKVYQLYYDLMFVDKSVPPYSVGWGWQELDPSFATGTVAMVQNGSWIQQRKDGGISPNSWKTAAFPYCINPSTYMEVKVEGVGAFTKHKQETIDFLEWLWSRDNMVKVSKTDNLPSRSDAIDSPYWESNEQWKDNFIEEVATGFTYPSIAINPILQGSMDLLQEVMYKTKTPHEAAVALYNIASTYLSEEVND
jgi:multiple sugar transport system substrate-binding protein